MGCKNTGKIVALFFIWGVLTFTGCSQNPFIGVGNEVDVEKPTVKVTSHKNGQWVFKDFVLSGTATDNIGVVKINIRQIDKNSDGEEYIKSTWGGSISGGVWSRAFTLDGDFGSTTGQKTLEVVALDKKDNASSVRILIGITNENSSQLLITPREELLEATKSDPNFYKDPAKFSTDNYDYIEYFCNGTVTIKGYTKSQYTPDKSIRLNLYRTDLTNDTTPIYTDIIYKDVVRNDAKAKGNTVNYEFYIDTIGNSIANGTYSLEFQIEEDSGQILSHGKGYIYIDQETDKPKVFITLPGDSTFPESVAGGKAFDDDGLQSIYYIIYKKTLSPGDDYTTWAAYTAANTNDTEAALSGVITFATNPTLTPWTVNPTPKGTGEYMIKAVGIDKNAKAGDISEFTYTQTTSSIPEATIVQGDLLKNVKDEFTLVVSATAGGGEVLTNVHYKVVSDLATVEGDIPTDAVATTTVTKAFNMSGFVNSTVHDVTVTVYAVNSAGNKSVSVSLPLKGDVTKPVIVIDTPTGTLNGNATITGTVEDDWAGVKNLYIGYFSAMSDTTMNSITAVDILNNTEALPTLEKWCPITLKPGWTVDFDTRIVDNAEGKATGYNLFVAAVDKAFDITAPDLGGNVGYTKISVNIDQEADRPTATILSPANDSTTTPQSVVSGSATDDDGVRFVYVYMVKEGTPTYDTPPADYRKWDDVNTVDVSGAIIEFSTTPVNCSWKATMPNGSAKYKVYVFVADKNTPSTHNTDGADEYYDAAERATAVTYVPKLFDNYIVVTQKTSDSPTAAITNPTNYIYPGKGVFDLNMTFTGGNVDKVTKYYWKKTSAIPDKSDVNFIEVDPADSSPMTVTQSFDAASFFNTTVRELKIEAKCIDETHPGESNTAEYYLRADSRNPVLTITQPDDNTQIWNWFHPPAPTGNEGYIKGTITDDVKIERVTITDGTTIWDSNSSQVTLSGSDTSKTFEKQFTIADLGVPYDDENLVVTVYDAMGNTAVSTRKLVKENYHPTVAVTAPAADGTFQNSAAGFTISGTCSDNVAVATVAVKIDTKTGNATITGGTTWSIASSEFAFTDSVRYTIDVTAYDAMGNTGSATRIITIDNAPPVVVFTAPADAAVLNGTVTVTGNISDNASGIKAMYISYFKDPPTLTDYDTEAELEGASTTNISDIISGAGKKLFKIAAPGASWSHSYDTTKLHTDLVGHDNTIYVFAVDNYGNITKSSTSTLVSRNVKIDQSKDIPSVSVLSPIENGTTFPQSYISGTASDDDSVASVYYFVAKSDVDYGNGVGKAPASYTAWETYSDATETYICGKISGLAGTITSWQTPKTPNKEGTFNLFVVAEDNNTTAVPSNKSVPVAAYTFSQSLSSSPVVTNTKNPENTLRGEFSFASGELSVSSGSSLNTVTNIYYRVSSTKPADTGEQTLTAGTHFTAASTVTTKIDSSSLITFNTADFVSDTVYDIKLEIWAKNSEGNISAKSTVYYRADNTKPTITISSPATATIINGSQTIAGTTNDWSQVDALYFGYFDSMTDAAMNSDYDTKEEIAANATENVSDITLAAHNKWHKVSSPSLNWSYSFDTGKITSGVSEDYKLYVAAVDKVGNVNYKSMVYTIDQDKDKPVVAITNPAYTGDTTPPVVRNDNMAFIPKTYIIMGTVQDGDSDGIKNVQIDIDIMNVDGSKKSDVYPAAADSFVDVSSGSTMIIGGEETTWTYKVTNYVLSAAGEFYKVTVKPVDYYGKEGLTKTSYFIVSNEAPEVEIISPSIADPDGTIAYLDQSGTVISNAKDDIYWDANSTNNHIYYDDDATRHDWGWNSDLSAATFNIFDKVAEDSSRSDYYRMIFRAKDNGHLTKVEISVDGGSNIAGTFTFTGGIDSVVGSFATTIHDADKIKKMDVMKIAAPTGNYIDYTFVNDIPNQVNTAIATDWVYFFVDIDTTKLTLTPIIKVIATDNNDTTQYETFASVSVNIDNAAPVAAVKMWGVDSLTDIYDFGKTSGHEFIGGSVSDVGSSGVRYVNLYFWNNQAATPDAAPVYNENGSGAIDITNINDIAVPSGTHKVTIPENVGSVLSATGDIAVGNSTTVNPNYPNYWVRGYKYLSSGWRILKIYDNDGVSTDADGYSGTYKGISTKYGVLYPTDGKKLICLETVDNAGNKTRKFYEHTFSEYPPIFVDNYMSWASMTHATDKVALTDETTSGRKWISGDLVMSGTVRDYRAGTNPTPGINRVRVLVKSEDGTTTHRTYSTESDGTVEVTTGAVLPTSNDNAVTWSLAGQTTTGLSDGDYLIEVEVRDISGVTTVRKQFVHIDNLDPVFTITQPAAAEQVVKGDSFTVYGTANADEFDTNCVKVEIVEDSITLGTSSLSGLNWSQVWDLESTGFNALPDATIRTIKITLTDKAGNSTANTITVKKASAPGWATFTVNGDGGSFTYKTFADLYSDSIPVAAAGTPVYLRAYATSTTNIVLASEVADSPDFTDAKLYLSGITQSGVSYRSTTSSYATFGTSSGATVSTNNTVTGLADGEYTYRAQLFQGASEINMKKYFIVDKTKPNIWAKIIENTDYVVSGTTKLGHIDANPNLAGYTAGADAVSGVIKVQVKVKDNYLLKNIKVKMTDYDFGSGADTAFTLLERNASTGVWEAAASRGSIASGVPSVDYFAVNNVVQSLQANSDFVVFTLEFNTAYLTNVAGLNKPLQFTATDWVGNATDTGSNEGTDATTFTNISSASILSDDDAKPVQMILDVVPYISRITTYMSGAWLSNPSAFDRTAMGHYPVWVRTTAGVQSVGYEAVTVTGYNINTDTTATVNGGGVAVSGLATPFTSCIVTLNDSVTSGGLVLTSSSIDTTNNVNSDTSDTNKEPNNLNNNTLLDDRYLDIWDFLTLSGTTQAKYPVMKMTGDTLNFSYGLGASQFYIRTGVTGNNGTATLFEECYSQYGPSAFDFDSNNNTYAVSIDTDRMSDSDNNATKFTFFAKSIGNNSTGSYGNYTSGTNKRLLECNWDPTTGGGTYNNYRSINPDMVVKGGGTDANRAKVYLTYYDQIQQKLKFRYITVGASAQDIRKNGGTALNDFALCRGGQDNGSNDADNDGSEDSYILIADSTNGSPYASVGVTSGGVTVIAWYDAVAGYLRFKYSTDVSVASPTWATAINHPDVTGTTDGVIDNSSAGEYVDIVVDDQDHIHIAYFDATYQNLKYAYIDAYNSTTASVVTVDNFFSAGTNLSIDYKVVGGNRVPYITYYQEAKTGSRYPVRIAYRKDFTSLQNGSDTSDFYTGKWECSSIPAQYNVPSGAVTYYKISLDFNSSGVPYVSYYTNGGIEYAKLK